MSKTLSSKRVYDSDDGFVEDAPKTKKQKSEPKQRNTKMQKDDDGNEYWELTGRRRVQVTEFKGTTMVGIREFYTKDEKTLPGKKGIAMTIDQYTAFLDLIPDIERVLKSKGIKIPRPQYDKKSTSKGEGSDKDEDDGAGEDEEDEDESSPKHKGKLDKFKMKRNHEATSSSEEG